MKNTLEYSPTLHVARLIRGEDPPEIGVHTSDPVPRRFEAETPPRIPTTLHVGLRRVVVRELLVPRLRQLSERALRDVASIDWVTRNGLNETDRKKRRNALGFRERRDLERYDALQRVRNYKIWIRVLLAQPFRVFAADKD
jgi:hypothetical protein